MEKKDLLGVRKKTAAGKRRSKVAAPAKTGGAGRLAKAIADYLAFDSYMYAPLVCDPPAPPATTWPPPAPTAPSAPPPSCPPEKEELWCKNTETLGELPSLPARSLDMLELVDLCPFCINL